MSNDNDRLSNDPARTVFVVTFALKDSLGKNYQVVLDRGTDNPENEQDAVWEAINEIENADPSPGGEAEDYPTDLDLDKDHVVSVRMTAAEAMEAEKDPACTNQSWWG